MAIPGVESHRTKKAETHWETEKGKHPHDGGTRRVDPGVEVEVTDSNSVTCDAPDGEVVERTDELLGRPFRLDERTVWRNCARNPRSEI